MAGDAGVLPEVVGDAAEFADSESVTDIKRGMQRVLTDDEYGRSLISRGQTHIGAYSRERAGAKLKNYLLWQNTG